MRRNVGTKSVTDDFCCATPVSSANDVTVDSFTYMQYMFSYGQAPECIYKQSHACTCYSCVPRKRKCLQMLIAHDCANSEINFGCHGESEFMQNEKLA